jgi:hypothetical protein
VFTTFKYTLEDYVICRKNTIALPTSRWWCFIVITISRGWLFIKIYGVFLTTDKKQEKLSKLKSNKLNVHIIGASCKITTLLSLIASFLANKIMCSVTLVQNVLQIYHYISKNNINVWIILNVNNTTQNS